MNKEEQKAYLEYLSKTFWCPLCEEEHEKIKDKDGNLTIHSLCQMPVEENYNDPY